jgi:hypothetical protein
VGREKVVGAALAGARLGVPAFRVCHLYLRGRAANLCGSPVATS